MEENLTLAQSYISDLMGVSDECHTQEELIQKLDNSINQLKYSLKDDKGLKENIGYALANVLNLASYRFIDAHDALNLVATKERHLLTK